MSDFPFFLSFSLFLSAFRSERDVLFLNTRMAFYEWGCVMSTGNRVIVVMEHPARKYVSIVRKLFGKYDEVMVSARGRHFARLAEVMKLLRPYVRVKKSLFSYADKAPELGVIVVPARSEGGGDA